MWKWETIEEKDLSDRVNYGVFLGGCRKIYRVFDNENERFITADYAITYDVGPETMLFNSDRNGYISDWLELYQDLDDQVTNNSAIEEFVNILNKGDEK